MGPGKIRRRFVVGGAALAGGLLLWPAKARATPDFPAAVEQDLMLSRITIDPPNGCTLCHPTDAGGTTLKPFGNLLQQYGVVPYNTASLAAALGEVEMNQPQLIADIKAGRDPSPDINNVPTPEYGCAVTQSREGSGPGAAWCVSVALFAVGRARRRARRVG
jgi:uncharacterized protein (TIGR03382 family)